MSVPNLEAALAAWETEMESRAYNDHPTFLRDLFADELTPGLALNRYLTHYGQRTYWTHDALASVLVSAGWGVADEFLHRRAWLPTGETTSGVERITELDGRPDESLILEAVRR